METAIRPGETPLQHHKRLVYGKLVDHTLADVDYAELSEEVYGQEYSSDVARRMMYGSRKTLELMDQERMDSNSSISDDIDAKMVELKKEQQRFYDQRTAFNKVVRERTREEELNAIIADAIQTADVPELDYTPHTVLASDNDLLVSLNDIHYGIEVNNAWNTYNPEVCKEMMQKYLNYIISVAERHGSENCIIYNCGDNISGKIHMTIQLANRENVVKQVKGVSELISEFLAELSPYFRTVKYVSVSGNHTRLDTKENSPYDERLDDLVEWYLAARLQNFENIEICSDCRIDPTIFLLNIRGKLYCGVHGDYDTSAANITALQQMAEHPLYAVLCGHKHYNKCDEVQGIKVVMAGSFVSMDDYCVTKRIYGSPEQMIMVCDESGILCHYDIPLR